MREAVRPPIFTPPPEEEPYDVNVDFIGTARERAVFRKLISLFPAQDPLVLEAFVLEEYEGRYKSIYEWFEIEMHKGEDEYLLPGMLNYVDFEGMQKGLGLSAEEVDLLFEKDPELHAFPQLDNLDPKEYQELLPYFDFNSYVEDMLQRGIILVLPAVGRKVDILWIDELSHMGE